MIREQNIFRPRSQDISKEATPSPSTEISEADRSRVGSNADSNFLEEDFIISNKNYDENQREKFELMNVKIVVYGLTGLVCEEQPSRKRRIFPRKIEIAQRKMKTIGTAGSTDESSETKELETTTAVVSCHKNGNSGDNMFETFLPSLPLGHPVATSLNKINYDAAWPSAQSLLEQDDLSRDRSAFTVIRSMKQAAFKPGIGGRSNYCHETIELAINISRGTELIRLGTALLVINGAEEGEVEMNVSTIPFEFSSKKLKKKKNKYGYFSNDTSTRFYLDKKSTLKVGIQVIPEASMRLARAKEQTKQKGESVLNELLENDHYNTLLSELDNNDKKCEAIQKRSIPSDQSKKAIDEKPTNEENSSSLLPYILCGSVPTSWMTSFFNSPEIATPEISTPAAEPEIPKEIVAEENVDQYIIKSLMSSVSEFTEGSVDHLLEGKIIDVRMLCVIWLSFASHRNDSLMCDRYNRWGYLMLRSSSP